MSVKHSEDTLQSRHMQVDKMRILHLRPPSLHGPNCKLEFNPITLIFPLGLPLNVSFRPTALLSDPQYRLMTLKIARERLLAYAIDPDLFLDQLQNGFLLVNTAKRYILTEHADIVPHPEINIFRCCYRNVIIVYIVICFFVVCLLIICFNIICLNIICLYIV